MSFPAEAPEPSPSVEINQYERAQHNGGHAQPHDDLCWRSTERRSQLQHSPARRVDERDYRHDMDLFRELSLCVGVGGNCVCGVSLELFPHCLELCSDAQELPLHALQFISVFQNLSQASHRET